MSEWIYFLHPPRENFAATMTEDEVVAFDTQVAGYFPAEEGEGEDIAVLVVGQLKGLGVMSPCMFSAKNIPLPGSC